jgi:hypothetical protein
MRESGSATASLRECADAVSAPALDHRLTRHELQARHPASIKLFIGTLGLGLALSHPAYANYDDCILEHMKGISSDTAAEAVKAACRAQNPIPWEASGEAEFLSATTKDNDNRAYISGSCPQASPDGRYCADLIAIVGEVKNDKYYERRFTPLGSACPVSVASGPKGWFKVTGCALGADGRTFKATVLAWTRPQTFKAKLKVESRKR